MPASEASVLSCPKCRLTIDCIRWPMPRALTPAEKNYAVTELETLAVVWALTHFHVHLYGHDVVVYMDHSAVKVVFETIPVESMPDGGARCLAVE